MNKKEVIATIKKAEENLGGILVLLCGENYAAGYSRAICDMVKLFDEAPIAPDFEAEREAMQKEINRLKGNNEALIRRVNDMTATMQQISLYINAASEILNTGNRRKTVDCRCSIHIPRQGRVRNNLWGW